MVKRLGGGALAGWAGWWLVPQPCWIRPAEIVLGLHGVELDSWLLCSEEVRNASPGPPQAEIHHLVVQLRLAGGPL